MLLQSELFRANKDYVRIQIVYSLLQEDEPAALHVIASFLLFDGKENEPTFEMMNSEGCFSRLIELVKQGKKDDSTLHRMLLELLYEMSRVQRLSAEDLGSVDDDFMVYLFNIIEELSDDVDDPYHYPVIRVLVRRSSFVWQAFSNCNSSSSSTSNGWLQRRPHQQSRIPPRIH